MKKQNKRIILMLLSVGILTTAFCLLTKVKKEQGMEGIFVSSNLIRRMELSLDPLERDHQVSDRKIPIYCVKTQEAKVALSFDAAWGNEDTQQILDILKKCNVHVTFFVTGGWVDSYPEDIVKIYEAGHDIGNHSQNHYDSTTLSAQEQKEELMTVHEKVKKLTGYDMFLFRPPYGAYNTTLVEVCLNENYYPIQWDVDSLDWKNYGVDSIVSTVLKHKHLGNGSIILMHNGAEYTASALEAVITGLQSLGYEIVPVSQLILKDHYQIDHEGRQCGNGE